MHKLLILFLCGNMCVLPSLRSRPYDPGSARKAEVVQSGTPGQACMARDQKPDGSQLQVPFSGAVHTEELRFVPDFTPRAGVNVFLTALLYTQTTSAWL
jgi:hypothetical protein